MQSKKAVKLKAIPSSPFESTHCSVQISSVSFTLCSGLNTRTDENNLSELFSELLF